MIDATAEALLTLSQAADELPRRRRGRKTNISTLYRWSQAGCRDVRLETTQVGATRCTSREALQRFFERLSQRQPAGAVGGGYSSSAVGVRSVAQRQRRSAEAGRQLEQLGA